LQLAALSFRHLLTKYFIYFQDCQSGRKKGKPHGGKPVSCLNNLLERFNAIRSSENIEKIMENSNAKLPRSSPFLTILNGSY
jgi:hypothetical protein